MEEIATEGARWFLTQGVLGALVLLLLAAVAVLYRARDRAQEARLADAKEAVAALKDATAALGKLSEGVEKLHDAMEARTRAFDAMAGELRDLRLTSDAADQRTRDALSGIREAIGAALTRVMDALAAITPLNGRRRP
jgi:biopolymer transport protein ExbB/TolQ